MTSWIVYGLVAIAALGVAWGRGYMTGSERLYTYQAEQAKQETRIAKAREVVTTKIVTKYIKVAGETKVVTNTIEKEVKVYADANTGHCLDAGWGRLHDASALNRVPNAAAGPDEAIGAPKAAQAIETVTGNYAACHRTADRLDALHEWVNKQAAVK